MAPNRTAFTSTVDRYVTGRARIYLTSGRSRRRRIQAASAMTANTSTRTGI
jgi:hypothetical protein